LGSSDARLALLAAVVIWGWTFVATKVALSQLAPIELFGFRLLIALPVLLLIARLRSVPFFPRPFRPALVVGALLFAAHFYIQINGLRFTTATRTGWIIAVTPVVVALLSVVILRERLTRPLVLGIAMATTGILILVSQGRLTDLGWIGSVGDWLILASAHTWALYTIAIRDLTRTANPLTVTIAVLTPAAVGIGVYLLLRFEPGRLTGFTYETVVALLFLGVLGTAVAHWCWQIGVARVGAAKAGVFLYLEPLATTALAVPYLGERFAASTVVGGALVLAGVWIAERRRT
jgi:drug/metabolite transporter (DMT)-like permease